MKLHCKWSLLFIVGFCSIIDILGQNSYFVASSCLYVCTLFVCACHLVQCSSFFFSSSFSDVHL